MFLFVVMLFKEPRRSNWNEEQTISLVQAAINFWKVLSNGRFILFLLIFSGYYVAFWQQFIILPIYIHDYINPKTDTELLLMTDSLTVIALQMPVGFLVRRIPAMRAVALGALISGSAWLIMIAHPSAPLVVLTIFLIAVGEVVQQPRYYEYISRLAPAGQQGTHMGFAFLPIGIGSLVGGWFGGKLVHHFGEVTHQPARIWWAVTTVGVATAALLAIYDKSLVARARSKTTEESCSDAAAGC